MSDSDAQTPDHPNRPALVTWTLIAASVAVAILSKLGDKLEVLTWLTFADLHQWYGLEKSERTVAAGLDSILHGQVWRLVTPIFIHFGLLHILVNMLWMKDLGELIERRWSPRTLAALVLVSGIVANLAQFAINWDLQSGLRTANVLSGGMSGVVYCLLGYVWMRGPSAGVRLHQQTVWMMLAWLAICFTGALGRIGNSAHLAGLIVGVVWGRVAAARVESTSRT
jgi:GlpG protein